MEDYGTAFNLNAYKAQKTLHIAELLSLKDPYTKEILQFAKDRGYRFPMLSCLINASGFFVFKRLIKGVLRKFKALFRKKD
jgi:hypothetical protein